MARVQIQKRKPNEFKNFVPTPPTSKLGEPGSTQGNDTNLSHEPGSIQGNDTKPADYAFLEPYDRGSLKLKLNASNPAYEYALSLFGETLELVSNVLQKRNLFPLTQERFSRLDLSAASNIDVKFDKDVIKVEMDIKRVGADPIHITAVLSPGRDSITLSYGNGKISQIDRKGKEVTVIEA